MPTSACPHWYPRRILLAVAAHSPQIVTETLYALTQQTSPSYVPTEIHVITTGLGHDFVKKLITGVPVGKIDQLCTDYHLPLLAESTHIHLISDNNSEVLADIRSHKDNNYAADYIMRIVRKLTTDPESSLTVSLSGGRRTMTYFAGSAIGFFGRPQDRLTHVLVEDKYSFMEDFYYPPPSERMLTLKNGAQFDASKVEVVLANIPFVRLREVLPNHLLEREVRFSNAVNFAQDELEPPRVTLCYADASLHCGSSRIPMKPIELAFYTWFLERRLSKRPPIRWSDPELAEDFLRVYAKLFGQKVSGYTRASSSLSGGMSKEYFDSRKSRTNTALKKVLNKNEAKAYLIDAFGKRPETRFGLGLEVSAISLQ